ncbi:hypothetical protein [Pseudomonas sp. AB12(2023)]|uniref:hypothetical protein n=1 Tax=Pseudomonas sp. AB12(2023) TaxID=3048597 RepID=UPI002B2365F7|nr:hypothetical protein [Pseudomonas sp. AB12(2023)]MEB0221343.1 hypothetical protein [Pseudomonas sp. AB12(2023)]
MNLAWYLIRTFYALGLVPVAVLFIVLITHFSKDTAVTLPFVVACCAYFVLGYFVFNVVPKKLKARLMAEVRLAGLSEFNFTADFEAVSVLFNRYVGFNSTTQQIVYVDVADGTRAIVDFSDIKSWSIGVESKKPALLTLIISSAELARIDLRFDRKDSNLLDARLTSAFS